MKRIYTALITPFQADHQIDWEAFHKILEMQKDARVAGVVPCGTTGESSALTSEEKKKLILASIQVLKGTGIDVIAGTGTNNTEETIELSQWAVEQGVNGVILVTPYYNRPSQAGLEAHFTKIAKAIDCPIILYNVPARTGVSLYPDTILKLASLPNIIAIKEASGQLSLTSEILYQLSKSTSHLSLLSGDDISFLPFLSIGGSGVVSVISNLLPKEMVLIQNLMEKNDWMGALAYHQRLYPLFRDLFIETNPVPIKYAMAFAGICQPYVRLPLVSLSDSSTEKLKLTLGEFGYQKVI